MQPMALSAGRLWWKGWQSAFYPECCLLGAVWGIYALAIKAFSSVLVAFGIGAAPFSAYAGWILLGFIALGLLTGMVGCAISMKRYLKNGGGSLG